MLDVAGERLRRCQVVPDLNRPETGPAGHAQRKQEQTAKQLEQASTHRWSLREPCVTPANRDKCGHECDKLAQVSVTFGQRQA